ncbi:AAA family ATPase [Nucisporomicrobium flavum]|uniref:AAA family ATPase n=1 Tax=Nucisporomicrobium flavum TaxID=2785915 RepID=UPI003C305603
MGFVQHLSVRVPWHDRGWDGTVCRDPLANSACILLENIGAKRDDAFEEAHREWEIQDLNANSQPPCVAERATFLSARDHAMRRTHPYAWTSALKGLAEATVPVPAYSVHAIPFYWLHRANAAEVRAVEDVPGYRDDLEDDAIAAVGFEPPWVLHGLNQKALIEAFFRDVTAQHSLVFFYLKHTPFEQAGRRVLVGAALVDAVTLPGWWPTTAENAFPNHMWETVVRHTYRPHDGVGGIVLPLQKLADLAAGGADVTKALAHAPETGREFSYGAEHVPPDTAVASLLELGRAAQAAIDLGCQIPEASLAWLDDQVRRAWLRRGPAPGLPAVLARLTFAQPTFAARVIAGAVDEGEDPWPPLLDALAGRPAPAEVTRHVTATKRKIWSGLPTAEQQALRLLSRFDLTPQEVDRVLDQQTTMPMDLDELLANPYHLVTCSVDDGSPIPFMIVDRGCFPDLQVARRHPLPVDPPLDDAADERRVEAALVWTVATAQAEGHTLLPLHEAVEWLQRLPVAQPLPTSTTVLRALELDPESLDDEVEATWPQLCRTTLADGAAAYKLRSALRRREWIRAALHGLRSAPRHAVPEDLDESLDAHLGALDEHDPGDLADEQRARVEKKAALRELYASRVAVLNGPAGTGKTTLVRALAHRPEVIAKGVLLLAPTGKARVQLQNKVGKPAITLAQFLAKSDRYQGDTGQYLTTGEVGSRQRYGTVVVDEASMITEDMLAALLDALVPPDRLVLVGDPRQLPPIGAGRPFVDLERHSRSENTDLWPRVAPGWAELTVLRRQRELGSERDDLKLARWYGGGEIPEGFDEVWQRLRTGVPMKTVRAVPWNGRSAHQVLDDVLREEFDIDDDHTFALSYGATAKPHENGRTYLDYFSAPRGCGAWQVLSPVRGRAHGTVELNRHLKRRLRAEELERSLTDRRWRRVPAPLGPEQIVLGDKVVNLRNQWLPSWSRQDGRVRGYVANGEIGVVIGQLKSKSMTKPPRDTQVEFESQPGFRFTYWGAGDENDISLELAWALTVHKSQGSEFDAVILMLPAGIRGLSRELLYTALTRQTKRVVLCHEGPLDDLMDLTRATGSDTARRFTDLIGAPRPAVVTTAAGTHIGRLDAGLVHLTASGVLVRSKNEVIVAQILDDIAPGAWAYEQPLVGNDGATRYPDFTIAAADGRTVYWEHLGMLHDPGYREGWDRKRAWYAEQGILPADDGGGPAGTLMWTDDRGGVDVQAWRERAASLLGTALTPRPARAVKKTAAKKAERPSQ